MAANISPQSWQYHTDAVAPPQLAGDAQSLMFSIQWRYCLVNSGTKRILPSSTTLRARSAKTSIFTNHCLDTGAPPLYHSIAFAHCMLVVFHLPTSQLF